MIDQKLYPFFIEKVVKCDTKNDKMEENGDPAYKKNNK